METFTRAVAVLFVLSAMVKIGYLHSGEIPQRTTGSVVFDLVFDICMLIWAAVVLSS